METSPKKFHRVEKYVVRFGREVTFELDFGFKNFSMGNRQYIFFLLIFGNFLDQFYKFYALSIIINTFSLLCVKLEHMTKKYFAVCNPDYTR